ncbi:transcriptional regulator, partial [Enterococcus faecalis]|nr:transcriptional regulator [Enterococcus faecalis]
MMRKAYDRWGLEINSFNQNIAFSVDCDCGKLAKLVPQKNYFECPACHRKYKLQLGQ